MSSKKDMRRADLAIPYVDPPKSSSDADISSTPHLRRFSNGTMSSTMPMAAMFTRNRMIGWVSFVFSLQSWLGESPEQKKTASTPAYMSVFMSYLFPSLLASAGSWGYHRCRRTDPAGLLNARTSLISSQIHILISTVYYLNYDGSIVRGSSDSESGSHTAFPHNVTLASKGSATSSLPFFYHSISSPLTTHAPIFYRDIESRPSLTPSIPILNAVYYEKAEFMSIENLKTFDPFAEADEDTGETKQSQNYIHIRIQQRNGRKTLTTVQGLPKKFDQKKILKVIKKKFACNGTIVSDTEMGEVIQLQGDQRKDVQEFLTDKKEGLELDAKTIKVHGF
ncbi:Eukaryotic translation initiation factor SUI1 [Penicillium expansum]|nr:Eukaryotic translation initiation factor SUI1 [Penicillium expansum]KGO66252.1 Eukaryotic translation initiation factor SUI1 [Penicillium expansum]